MDTKAGIGLEAYRDDPEFTAPEMAAKPERDHDVERASEQSMTLAAGLSIGIGGGALAGEVLVEDVEATEA